MNVQEMVAEIPKLSKVDLIQLRELIDKNLRLDEQPSPDRNSVKKLRGLVKLGKPLPDDWDWKKVKEEYLLEKYS